MSEPTAQPIRIACFGAGPLPTEGSVFSPGVANRLWHFMQPALAAGHDCLLVSMEPGATGEMKIERREWRGRPWQYLRVRAEDCVFPGRLKQIVAQFRPERLAGAGTALASWAACACADGQPVWADLFGDPLAEIAIKARVLGADFDPADQIYVWQLLLDIFSRADAFSSVSRRQVDAILGQLMLAGRQPAPPICSMPCALESVDLFGGQPAIDRAAFIQKYQLPADARVVLWSGGFNAWADPDTLVEGLELAMDRDPALRLVATGAELPGYLSRVYEKFIARANASRHASKIHALGWLPLEEASKWLRAADIGIFTDLPCEETRLGGRNRLLYFAAARKPAVASRGTEVVEEMEAAGALAAFPTGDAAALADKILALIINPAEAQAIAGRGFEFARRNYEFAASAAPFLKFIAAPARSAAATPYIARYLDHRARELEQAELARYRSGRLARILSFLRGRKTP